ncbi:hypothetical protein CR513_09961, partial [Mucuna pruriens]
MTLCREFFELMQKEFEMSMMEELIFILRLQIKQELLKKFNLEDCKIMSTKMHPTSILSLDELNKKVDQTSYRGMIDSLLYLTTPIADITYLNGTTNLGLYDKKSDQYRLKGYSGVDFARDRIERKKHE